MELNVATVINQPRDVVYELVRDDVEKLVPYMPNIEEIVGKSSERDGSKLKVVRRWRAKAEVPRMAQKFIKPELFMWDDVATWDDDERSVEYYLESSVANDLYDARGKNQWVELDDGKMELRIQCTVLIYPERLPGVPRMLAGKVKPMVESLVGKMLKPNLTSLGDGINRYFAER
jgi:hypothetical protein